MAKIEHVSHIKSRVTREIEPEEFYGLTPTEDNSDETGSSPVKLNLAKRPTSDKILVGEIAINYKKGHETITIKNDNDEIVGFVNEKDFKTLQEIITKAIAAEKEERTKSITLLQDNNKEVKEDIEDIDLIVSAALNDLNSRIGEYDGDFESLENRIDELGETLEESIDDLEEKISAEMEDNELVISAALNDLNSRIGNSSTTIEELETTVNNLQDDVENLQDDTEDLDERMDNTVEEIEKMELVISTSLNDLNSRIESTTTSANERLEELDDKIDEEINTLKDDVEDEFDEMEDVVAASLNDLNARIIDLNELSDIVDNLKSRIISLTSTTNNLTVQLAQNTTAYNALNQNYQNLFNFATNGQETVDLGLPSGTLWAAKNIGASSITDNGLYFAWGEINGYADTQIGTNTGQRTFNPNEYAFGDGSASLSGTTLKKYNDYDLKSLLDFCDDGAHENFGGLWHLPTTQQINELTSYVTAQLITNYLNSGVTGVLLTSTVNNNTLFLPANAYYANTTKSNMVISCLWLRDLDTSDVRESHILMCDSTGLHIQTYQRDLGLGIRPVIG